jgi:HK97 family phage major capsid protein
MSEKTDVIRQAMAKLQTRTFTIGREAQIDEESRTVNLAFASDKPIEHWFGNLELSMEKKAVRTERLSSGAPLLMDHNAKDQIGVVTNFSFDKDGVARADVKFSRSTRGEEIFQDIKDGIRTNVSVGFMVYAMDLTNEKETQKGAIPQYRSEDWEPMEISIVSIPADISVGVGRSFQEPIAANAVDYEQALILARGILAEQLKNSIPEHSPTEREISNKEENTMTPEEKAAAEKAAQEARSAEIASQTAARRAEVVGFAEIFGEGDLAREMLLASEAVTIDDVRVAIRAKKKEQQTVVTVPVEPAASVAARNGGVQLARSVPRYGRVQNFSGENAAERAYRFGQWFLAVRGRESAMKFCRDNGILIRTQSEGINENGGFLVPEEFGNDLIDLREQFGIARRNFKMVPMASDTRSDPRRTGGLTPYFEGESDALTASTKNWDRVSLTAKKLTVLTRYTTEVNEDAVINMADDLAGEIAYAFANKEDNCAFIGDGTSTYGGMQGLCTKIKGLSGTIANIAGLVVATGTGYGTDYSSTVLVDFEKVAAKLPVYADTPRAKWYTHKAFYWNVMVKAILAAGGVTGNEIESGRAKKFLGYDVEFVQVMPSTSAVSQVCALLGDLSLAASFGSRRDTTIAVSEHSRFANDEIEIRGTERFDINVHDVGNASATAGSRVPGPVVGLITAAS